MARRNWNRIFVTGGASFLGLRVVAALIEQGADVTVLVRPENEDKLGALRRHVRLVSGNVWDRASLKGRSRGHGAVVHLVGSIHAQPERGLTFQQLNLVSARNAISMAVSDGVPYFRSEEHTSELQSRENLVCRLLLEKKKIYLTTNSFRLILSSYFYAIFLITF